jgi:hypothetical protein
MPTMQDIVSRAYRKLGVVAEDEPMTADQGESGITALNMMIHQWKLRGIAITYSDLTLVDAFPLLPQFEEGTVYLLASRLAPDNSKPLEFDADDWFRAIQASYLVIEPAVMPSALTRTSSQFRGIRSYEG